VTLCSGGAFRGAHSDSELATTSAKGRPDNRRHLGAHRRGACRLPQECSILIQVADHGSGPTRPGRRARWRPGEEPSRPSMQDRRQGDRKVMRQPGKRTIGSSGRPGARDQLSSGGGSRCAGR
jgi:hypothetical protein